MDIQLSIRRAGLIFFLFLLPSVTVCALPPRRPRGVVYLFPPDSAQYVMPQSTIIVRFDGNVGQLPDPDSLFHVVGSISGTLSGTTFVSEGKTVIFSPATPFAWNEEVRVDLAVNAVTHSADPSTRFSFAFHTSPENIPPPLVNEFLPTDGYSPVSAVHPFQKDATTLTDSLPSDFPIAQITDNGDTSSGVLFLDSFAFTFSTTPYLMILQNNGAPLYYRAMKNMCTDFKIQPNGMLSYFDQSVNAFFLMDSTYAIVDTITCRNGPTTDIHELRILPNGHALVIGDEPHFLDMGRFYPGGNPTAKVYGEDIQEIDQSHHVVFQWRSWDHYAITDATHEDLTAPSVDYVHANAIEIDTDGNFLLSCRHMDEITKIDHVTGDIIWRMGGKHNQFTFVNDSIGFSHQHAVRRIENGDFTLFDNGNYHTPPFSRAVEYAVDQTNKTVRLVWEYRNSPDIYGEAMGYVQRLSNGNTLICWGATNPSVTEVKPDGTKIYELNFPPGVFTYRAYRLNWPSAIVDAVAGGATPTVPSEMRLEQNYPNPFNPKTVISGQWTADSDVRLEVFDILGREVATLANGWYPAGKYTFAFDGTNLASGVYFYRLTAGSYSALRKMLLIR